MNLQIKDSYKVKSIKEIRKEVTKYYNQGLLDKRRTIDSYVKEWYAHNWLYEKGLFKSHTKDVDLDGSEKLHRIVGYEVIYKLFK